MLRVDIDMLLVLADLGGLVADERIHREDGIVGMLEKLPKRAKGD